MFFRYVKAALRVQDSRETGAPYIYGSNQQNSTPALEPLQRESCIIDIILAIIKTIYYANTKKIRHSLHS